jgi:hypothetical protein
MGYELILKNLEVEKVMKQFGKEIADARLKRSVSYNQVYLETGVDYNTQKKIENGGDVMLKSYLKVYKFLLG